MWSRLGVRWRLLLAFLAISAFAVIAAVAAMYSFQRVGDVLDMITHDRVPAVLASQQLTRQAEKIVSAAPALITAKTFDEYEAEYKRLSKNLIELKSVMSTLHRLDIDSKSLTKLERFVTALRANFSNLNTMIRSNRAILERGNELLQILSATDIAFRKLLVPLLQVMDKKLAELRNTLDAPDTDGSERSARVDDLLEPILDLSPLHDVQARVSKIYSMLTKAAVAENRADLDELAIQLQRSIKALEKSSATLDPDLRDRFIPRVAEFRELIDGESSIVHARKQELRHLLLVQSLLDKNVRMSKLLSEAADQLISAVDRDIGAANSEALAVQQTSTRIMVAVVILSVACSILIVWLYVGRNLVARLTGLSESMLAIADGNLETQIPGGGMDEIGHMAKALNVFRATAIEVRDTNLREIQTARKRLIDAIESISEGFSLFDADDRLVVCNSTYTSIMYPGIEDAVTPGRSFEAIIRSAAERGLIADAEGRIEDWVAERLAGHHDPGEPHLQRRGDGRWILINERKTDDGGTVAVYSDITELKQREEELRNQKERMEDELNIGREIQMSMVPLTFPPFPDRKEFSVYGSLEPAREIGGDFYDFFFIDDDKLCFCIGDVSGKGVPAALFMAVTKTLIKSRATVDPSTASILTHVNDELSRDNPYGMFVTLFIGILNIRSGEFDYTNAGHNPPYLLRTDGPPEAMSDRHGPVVGAVNGMVYRKGTDVMHPGDILHMYTDGVTEEMDTDGQLFSDERLAALISTQTIDSVEAAVDKTVSAVKSFRGEKDAEDDVTVLAIQFFGAPMKASAAGLHVIVKNELSEITTVQERFREFGKAHGFSKDLERKMDMIFDELLSNIIWYAFSEGSEHEIEITAEQVRNRLTVTISDDGVPFNPLLKDPPDTSLAAKDRALGGLGILLVRKMADDLLYQRRIDKNVLTLIIRVDQSDSAS